MYRIYVDSNGNEVGINLKGTNTWIPKNTDNTDYQQYLAWLEEGNVPEEWNPEVPQ